MKDQKKESKFTIPCTHPKQWPHHYPLQSFFGEHSTLKLKKMQKNMMSK